MAESFTISSLRFISISRQSQLFPSEGEHTSFENPSPRSTANPAKPRLSTGQPLTMLSGLWRSKLFLLSRLVYERRVGGETFLEVFSDAVVFGMEVVRCSSTYFVTKLEKV